MSKIFVVTSGKGGVGKTTIVSNLGYRMASMGYKVLLMDLDFCLNNLDLALGVEDKINFDIIDVLEGKCRLSQAIIQDEYEKGLHYLPCSTTNISFSVSPYHIENIIREVSCDYDYIFIDSPAGIGIGFERAVVNANSVIVVTTPHISSIRDAKKVLSMLCRYNMMDTYLIVNRARGDLMMEGDMISIDKIKEYLEVELIGVVPEDDYIALGNIVATSTSVDAIKSISMIGDMIARKGNKIYDCTKKYRGIFGAIKRCIKRYV